MRKRMMSLCYVDEQADREEELEEYEVTIAIVCVARFCSVLAIHSVMKRLMFFRMHNSVCVYFFFNSTTFAYANSKANNDSPSALAAPFRTADAIPPPHTTMTFPLGPGSPPIYFGPHFHATIGICGGFKIRSIRLHECPIGKFCLKR